MLAVPLYYHLLRYNPARNDVELESRTQGRVLPHLRRTAGSWAAREGVSIYQVSSLLGHADVQTTERFYAFLETDNQQAAVDAIAATLKRGTPMEPSAVPVPEQTEAHPS